MNLSANHHPTPRAARAAAFTLIEMMITAGLLGFIVLGLTAMFVQTQKAFRAGTAQTDVLETGRAVVEHISRQIEQTAPCRIPVDTKTTSAVTTFDVRYTTFTTNLLNGSDAVRTNVLTSLYLLQRSGENRKWTALGYVVAATVDATHPLPIANLGVGTLYQFQYPTAGDGVEDSELFDRGLSKSTFTRFRDEARTQAAGQGITTNSTLSRLADGVVGFQVWPYDLRGFLITNTTVNNNISATRLTPSRTVPLPFGQYNYSFYSNAVPAYVDLELSILENDAYEKFKSLPQVESVRKDFLKRAQMAGRIHVFRRHIAVRNVDQEAYK